MPRYFTHYWKFDDNKVHQGQRCDTSWSNQFRKRRFDIGDIVYIITTINREPYLVGRMIVGNIIDDPKEIIRRYGRKNRSQREVIQASDCTDVNFKRRIPDLLAQSLLFKTTKGIRGFIYESGGRLDKQTSRGIKELLPAAAHALDGLLGQSSRIRTDAILTEEISDTTGVPEGAKQQVTVNRYERNRANRQACLNRHGYVCSICDFDFEQTYGPAAKGIIHVHHLIPLSSLGQSYTVDPINDLIPVCPNCHAVIHSNNPPWTPDEVRAMLRRQRLKKKLSRKGKRLAP